MDCYDQCADALADEREAGREACRDALIAWIEGHPNFGDGDFGPGFDLVLDAARANQF